MTYLYDEAGNRKQKTAAANVYYAWDARSRLSVAEPVGGRVTFGYDGSGRRVSKESGGDTTRYLWDFQKVLQETDGGGTTEHQYLTTDKQFGELVSGFDGTDTRYYQMDALGSAEALLDGSGSETDKYSYRAYGLATQTVGSDPQPFTFVGKQGYSWESEIGLYLLGAGGNRAKRPTLYDPATAVFLQPDPVWPATGDASPYTYCGNNPVNATDPSGLDVIAVGEDAAQEVLWQLQHTYQISRDSIQVVDLGAGGEGVWENPGGSGKLYLIIPKSDVRQPPQQRDGQPAPGVDWVHPTVKTGKGDLTQPVGRGSTLGPDSQVPAIQALYDAFWDRGTPYFVARLARDATIPGTDTPLQGLWHTTVADGKQLYVGGPSKFDLLTREQKGRMSGVLLGPWQRDAFIIGDPGLNEDGVRISGFVDEKSLIREEKAARAELERRLNPPRGSLEYEQRFFREHFGVPGEFSLGLLIGGAHAVGHMLFLPMPMPEFTREFASSAYGVGFALGYGGSNVGLLAAGTPSQFRLARSMRDLMAVEARETSRSLAAQMMGSAESALSRRLYREMTVSPGGVFAPGGNWSVEPQGQSALANALRPRPGSEPPLADPEWLPPTRAQVNRAHALAGQHSIPQRHLRSGYRSWLDEPIPDTHLYEIAEGLGVEVSQSQITNAAGKTRYLFQVGTPGDVGLINRNYILDRFPGAIIGRVVHTHPPSPAGIVGASTADLRVASIQEYPVVILTRTQSGVELQTWTPTQARGELLARGETIPLPMWPFYP